MPIILDASAALAWLIERDTSKQNELADRIARQVMLDKAHVPALWFSEVASGVLKAERVLTLAPALTAKYLAFLEALPINLDRQPSFAQQSSQLMLARIHAISAYDAAYLELAIRTGASLATFDQKLAEVATKCHVSVFK